MPGHPGHAMQEAMTAELPVWVFGRCRWVSGVCRRTTCQDVLEAVLATPGPGDHERHEHHDAGEGRVTNIDPSAYVIVERWKGVERRLDSRVRLLKVWAAWGEAQSEVQLLVRRACEKGRHGHHAAAAARAGSRAGGRHRKRAERSAKRPRPSPTLHDHGQDHGRDHGQDEVHRLMKLILAQGETIAGQLRRLREREAQIERLETETHREREAQHGKDYVLAAYLGTVGQDAEEDPAKDAAKDTPKSRTQHAQPGRPGRCGIRPRQLAALDDVVDWADESDDERRDERGDEWGPKSLPASLASLAADAPGRQKNKDAARHPEAAAPVAAGPAPEDGGGDLGGDLGARIALWEKVVKVNKRLEQQEERLVRLYVGFRRSDPDGVAVDDREQLRTSLARLEQDIADGRRSMEANADLLSETDALLDAKRRLLRRLLAEMEAADLDTARLMAARDAARDAADAAMASPPPPPPPAAVPPPAPPPARADAVTVTAVTGSERMTALSCGGQLGQLHQLGKGQDNDSNSDTGLSSLHSSSEEGVYILDTLV
ncbi:ras association domain-containing protein 10-like [Thrips palmi]|uniref:Ras association domain-containing protein 10-like n=1 Tax=Thrips palmi TaxID=161013 RepID=A0A6P9A1P0_THRPL|nr:ras association domain-containing protein 10-like [Thrips palmi]